MQVKKAIIPAAGLGTRFLPATKALPKELLPIVDRPSIQYIVEEAVHSGIEDILIISGRGKWAIEDHFDKSYELEKVLEQKEKDEQLDQLRRISELADIHYIRQKEPRGLGHAVWCARKFIGDEPFAVLLGDDIVRSETPCLKQLLDVYDRFNSSVVGVQQVPESEVAKYGIVRPKTTVEERIIATEGLVEKPDPKEAPSNFAIMGRYVLRPEILDVLEDQPPGAGGEIQLTDAINRMNEEHVVLAYEFTGRRYDVGDKFGFIQATVELALEREDLRDQVAEYLQQIMQPNLTH